jgi:hypothetical protein
MEQKLRLVQGGAGRGDKRNAERRRVQVSGQIAWKDSRGQTHMAPVVTQDISDLGVKIECRSGLSIPLYRLVHFQIDKPVRTRPDLPESLRKQSVLAAIFRVGDCSEVTGAPTEYALRLMVEPQRLSVAATKSA